MTTLLDLFRAHMDADAAWRTALDNMRRGRPANLSEAFRASVNAECALEDALMAAELKIAECERTHVHMDTPAFDSIAPGVYGHGLTREEVEKARAAFAKPYPPDCPVCNGDPHGCKACAYTGNEGGNMGDLIDRAETMSDEARDYAASAVQSIHSAREREGTR